MGIYDEDVTGDVKLQSLIGLAKHTHGPNCRRMLKHVLYDNEEILLEVRQSYLEALSPIILVATNKRLITMYSSFWGRYFGYDLFHPTTYSIMPYKYMIGVSISKGKVLSSIKIHTQSSIDVGSQIKDENEIHGIRSKSAMLMTKVIGEILQFTEEEHKKFSLREGSLGKEEKLTKVRLNNSQKVNLNELNRSLIQELSLDSAKAVLKRNNSVILWLGLEPDIYVSKLLNVNPTQIKILNLRDIERYNEDEALALDGTVILSYDGVLSIHLAEFLKDKYGVLTYVIKGGLYSILEDKSKNIVH